MILKHPRGKIWLMGCNCDIKKRMAQMARDFQGDPVYLDYNATTPVDPRLLGDLDRLIRHQWGNASSLHIMGGESALLVDTALERAGAYFGKAPVSFHFCSSGCEGISGFLSALSSLDLPLVSTVTDHSVLTQSAKELFPLKHKLLGVDSQGKIRLEELDQYQKEKGPVLLFYSPVNHESGAVQPVEEIYSLVSNQGGLVLLDAVQACYRLPPDSWAPFCHGFVVSGHKFHVPKGIALIQADPGLKLTPFRYGGNHGHSLFPGTENVPGISLLGRGLELLSHDALLNRKILTNLTAEGERILRGVKTEFIRESPSDSAAGILCISLPGLDDMESFFLHLADKRVCISRFSACTGNVKEKSVVLTAMGVPENRATRSLRLSFGKFTKRQDFFVLKEAIDSYV